MVAFSRNNSILSSGGRVNITRIILSEIGKNMRFPEKKLQAFVFRPSYAQKANPAYAGLAFFWGNGLGLLFQPADEAENLLKLLGLDAVAVLAGKHAVGEVANFVVVGVGLGQVDAVFLAGGLVSQLL